MLNGRQADGNRGAIVSPLKNGIQQRCTGASPFRAFVWHPLSGVGEACEPHARPGGAVRVDELDAGPLHNAADGIDCAAVRLGQATFDAVQGPQRHAAFSRKPRHRPIQ
jgi:hypothetical protein